MTKARHAVRTVATPRLGTKMLCKTHNRVELVKKSDGWTVVLACGCERTANLNVPVELMARPNEPLTAEELRRIFNLNGSRKNFPSVAR